jgi:hypothetical protein
MLPIGSTHIVATAVQQRRSWQLPIAPDMISDAALSSIRPPRDPCARATIHREVILSPVVSALARADCEPSVRWRGSLDIRANLRPCPNRSFDFAQQVVSVRGSVNRE